MKIIRNDGTVVEFLATNCNTPIIIDSNELHHVQSLDTEWCVKFSKNRPVKIDSTRRVLFNRQVSLSAFIFGHVKRRDFVIDHINRNIFDNRKANLRKATFQQNCVNKTPTDVDKWKGVSWHPYYKQWEAFLIVNGKRLRIGLHDSIVDAAVAYNNAALKHFGSFAVLNAVQST